MRWLLLALVPALVGLPAPQGGAQVLPECPPPTLEPNPCPLWEARLDHPGGHRGPLKPEEEDYATSVAISPSGDRVFATGQVWDPVSGYDIWTLAHDAASGAELWRARHDGPESLHDRGHAIGVSPDGSLLYVTGEEDASYESPRRGHSVTLAYETATGALAWTASYLGPAAYAATRDLAVGPEGSRIYVTGTELDQVAGGPDAVDAATVAYDARTGEEEWATRYDSGGTDGANGIAVSPDGGQVYVAGQGFASEPTGIDYLAIAYDSGIDDTVGESSGGEQLWVAHLNGPGPFQDVASSVAVSPDGATVALVGITGGSLSPGVVTVNQVTTVVYEAGSGSKLWEDTWAPTDEACGLMGDCWGFGFDIAFDPQGTSVFVGGGAKEGGEASLLLIAYDARSGARRWLDQLGVPAHDGMANVFAIDLSDAGDRLVATGHAAVVLDGCFVISLFAGCVPTGIANDYMTALYDPATGERLWTARYNSSPAGTDYDFGFDVVLSPDGSKAYVTGFLGYRGAGDSTKLPDQDWSDWGTLAYELPSGNG